jgi:hypothetical protein
MPQVAGLALLGGVISAALFLALLTGLPGMVVFAYFMQLPLMLVGLTLGVAGSVIAVAGAVVVNGLIAGVLATIIYALVQAVPAVVVVRQALLSRQQDRKVEWFPPGLLLAQLAVLAALGTSVVFVLMLGEPGGLKGTIERFLTAALADLGAIEATAEPPPQLGIWVDLFPGLMAASWLTMVAINAVLAQGLAVRLGWNRRPSPDFAALELPGWLWPVIAGSALLALLSALDESGLGFLGRSLLIVLVVPYAFLGLAVIHALARRLSHPGLALLAVYAGVVLLGWPVLGILLLGFVEDWVQLRRRLI